MFRLLQNSLNFSETKLLHSSDIISLGNAYSAKMILYINIKLSANRLLTFLLLEICCVNVQYMGNAFLIVRTYQL